MKIFKILSIFLFCVILTSCTKQRPVIIDDEHLLNASQQIQVEQLQKLIFNEHQIIVDVHTTNLPIPTEFPQNSTEFPKVTVYVNNVVHQAKVFVETSAALQLPNVEKYITETLLPSFFESGRVGDGIVLSLSFIQKTLNTKNFEFNSDDSEKVVYKKELNSIFFDVSLINQATPEDAYQSFIYAVFSNQEALETLYTSDSVDFFEEYPLKDIEALKIVLEEPKYALRTKDNLSVVFFEEDSRKAPIFFKKEDEKWKVDWLARSLLIAYDDLKYWHFTDTSNIYMFAFDGYKFDKNGYMYCLTEDDYIEKDDEEVETGPKIIYSEQDAELLNEDDDTTILELDDAN